LACLYLPPFRRPAEIPVALIHLLRLTAGETVETSCPSAEKPAYRLRVRNKGSVSFRRVAIEAFTAIALLVLLMPTTWRTFHGFVLVARATVDTIGVVAQSIRRPTVRARPAA
jgi:hypothetical protein